MLRQFLFLVVIVAAVSGHGRVTNPPSRASMWRVGYPTPANYDDNALFCGGFGVHHYQNGGKCGICGDAFHLAEPRPHELGGLYGSGIIVAEYEAGQVIPTTVEITVFHLGYWEFKICPDHTSNDQACFDEYLIELEEGGTKYYPPGTGSFQVNYKLPESLTCDHCVLQWRYTTGNNWGVCANGTGALGCGIQENFLACSDITIKRNEYIIPETGPLIQA